MEKPFPAYKGDEPYVFVSYAHTEADVVYPEIQWLHDQGFNIWYDEGISPGTVWRNELADSIKGANLFVFFVSPQSIDSMNCQREVNLAVDNGRSVLAVHLEETELPSGMDLTLSTIQAILKYDTSDQEYRTKLLSGASEHIQRGIAETGSTLAGSAGIPSMPAPGTVLTWLGWVAAVAFAVALAVTLILRPTGDLQRRVVHADLNLHPGGDLVLAAAYSTFQLSPDGKSLVFSATRKEDAGTFFATLVSRARKSDQSLFVRDLETGDLRRLEGTEGGSAPFFSADGSWVGFVAQDELRRIAVEGGAPLKICNFETGHFGLLLAAVWSPDDRITFSTSSQAPMFDVSASGGIPRALTAPAAGQEHRVMQLLPASDEILFAIVTEAPQGPGRVESIGALNTSSGIIRTGSMAGDFGDLRYLDSGHLVWSQWSPATDDWSLVAMPFDVLSLTSRGTPHAVVNGMHGHFGGPYALFSISDNGTLVYAPFVGAVQNSMLAWLRRNGESTVLSEKRPFHYPQVSADGRRAIVAVHVTSAGHDLYLYDLERGTSVVFATGGDNHHALWSPDGKAVVFAYGEMKDDLDIYRKPIEAGEKTAILEREGRLIPRSFAPDGTLIFEQAIDGKSDLWLLRPDGAVEPLLVGSTQVRAGVVSPDGRWFAYVQKDNNGMQIYLRPFPGPGQPRRVSSQGGVEPLWSPDGGEIYYRDVELRSLMAVPIGTAGDEPLIGDPVMLFQSDFSTYTYGGASYSVDPAGKRFLVLLLPEGGAPPSQLRLVVNWSEELEELMPTD